MRLPQMVPGMAVNPLGFLETIQGMNFPGMAQDALQNRQYDLMRQAAALTPPVRQESPVRPGEAGLATGFAALAKLLGAKDEDVMGGFNAYMNQRQSQADNRFQNNAAQYENNARRLGVEGQIAGMEAQRFQNVQELRQKAEQQHLNREYADAAKVRAEASDLVQKLMSAGTPEAARVANNALVSLGSPMAMQPDELNAFMSSIARKTKTQDMLKELPNYVRMLGMETNPMAQGIGFAAMRSLMLEAPDEVMKRVDAATFEKLKEAVSPKVAQIQAQTKNVEAKTLTENMLRGPKREQILQNIKTSASRARLNDATAKFLMERTRLYDDEFALKKFDREVDLYRADSYAQAVASGQADGADPMKAATQQRMALAELLSVNKAQLEGMSADDERRPALEAERDRLKARMWDITGESMAGDPRVFTNPNEIFVNFPDIQPPGLSGPIGGGNPNVRRPSGGRSAAPSKKKEVPKKSTGASAGASMARAGMMGAQAGSKTPKKTNPKKRSDQDLINEYYKK